MPKHAAEPIIVCPLAFERAALVKAGAARPEQILCVGPGAAGIERLAEMLRGEPGGPVILSGLAGAVDPSIAAGSAYVVSEVISSGDRRCRTTWRGSQSSATIATSREVLATPQMKADFAALHGAQLVDMESEPFARLAEARGWTWGIARGVSDDLHTALPPDVHAWVDELGNTRITSVLSSCARRPWQIGSLLTLRRNSVAALRALTRLLQDELADSRSQI